MLYIGRFKYSRLFSSKRKIAKKVHSQIEMYTIVYHTQKEPHAYMILVCKDDKGCTIIPLPTITADVQLSV